MTHARDIGMAAHVLEYDAVSLAYDRVPVVENLSLQIETGSITGLIGANGSGKSTLLRGLGRLLRPTSGTVLLDGKATHTMKTGEVAQRLAILPQGPVAPDGVTVGELVAQGRYPHQTILKQWSRADERAVARALALTEMTAFSDRLLDTLSGGQRQRAWLAMTLAQEAGLLLLDEPTTFLDLAHQIDVMELIRELRAVHGATVIAVLHDLNQAARYCDRLVVLSSGRVVASGVPWDIVTQDTVRAAFGLECRIVPDPVSGTPLCIPLGRTAMRNLELE